MKATKFRIYNYKSIIDSGYCPLASDITIFVGKNESGKTAALEALRDFDRDVIEFPQSAYPIDGNDDLPRVEIHFQIEQSDVDAIQAVGITLSPEFVHNILEKGLTIIKDGQGEYELADKTLLQLLNDKVTEKNPDPLSLIKTTRDRLGSLVEGRNLPTLDVNSSPLEIKRNAKELTALVKSFLPSFPDEKKQTEIVDALRLIVQESNKLTEQSLSLKDKLLDCIFKLMPRFIYFSEFIGNFPFEIPINKITETEAMIDFAKISGLDLAKLIDTEDIQKRINLLNRHCAIINAEFGNFWQQNQLELLVKPEGDKILFGVKEKNKTDFFKIDQRSKGFQWFLSFYLRLSTQKSKDHIILIDEPGTTLHAKAQNEILRVMEQKIATDTPVILSTHSPYLINPLRLDRIRPLVKTQQTGTKIHSHIAQDLDPETLIPINTSVGIDTTGALPLPGKQNIIVTDLADFCILNSLEKYIDAPGGKEFNLIPCPDERNLEMLISLLNGFGFDYRVVFNHRPEEEVRGQEMAEKFNLGVDKVIFIPFDQGVSAIDLFSPDDFYAYVLGKTDELDLTQSPSDYLRINNIDPTVLAKKFSDKAHGTFDIHLSDETIGAFQKLFNRIVLTPPAPFVVPPQSEVETKITEEIKAEAAPEVKAAEPTIEPQATAEPEKKKRWFFAGK